MSNILQLVALVPTPVLIQWIASNAIPYFAAAVSRGPKSWWTGAVTYVLATAGGFFSTWAAQGSHLDWKAALGATVVSIAVAALHHSKWLKATGFEDRLYALRLFGQPKLPTHSGPTQGA